MAETWLKPRKMRMTQENGGKSWAKHWKNAGLFD
jgi:hypothetical protein